jgi:hypothetical protein
MASDQPGGKAPSVHSGVPIPLDPSEPFYAPIGKLAVDFAQMEKTLNWAVWVLLQCTEGQWRAIIDQIQSIQNRIFLFQTLVRLKTKDPLLRDELTTIISALETANTRRNNILHGAWGGMSLPENRMHKFSYKAKGKLTRKLRGYTVSEITQYADECFQTEIHISKFMKNFDPGR